MPTVRRRSTPRRFGARELDSWTEYAFEVGRHLDGDDEALELTWRRFGEDYLAEAVTTNPGMRPGAWWRWDARKDLRPGESQADYLDRHSLWLRGERDRFCLFVGPPSKGMDERALRRIWQAERESILCDWIRRRPGTRPWGWWRWDSPEPRREFKPPRVDPIGGVSAPPITHESEGALLDRHDLWTDAERGELAGRIDELRCSPKRTRKQNNTSVHSLDS
jgi:hypothetical protein